MAFVKESLASVGDIYFYRLRSVLELCSFRRVICIFFAVFFGLARGRPQPLQSLLFNDDNQTRDVIGTIARLTPTTVYLDGVRSGVLSKILRKKFPRLRIVCDFDDLMSRRIEVLASMNAPISIGYLSKSVPRWVQVILLDGIVGRLVQIYEKRALISAEREIVEACDAVVLVSSVEARHLMEFVRGQVDVIPPVIQPLRSISTAHSVERFVFIGSDSLLQNRLTINFLVDLWKRVNPFIELHIFGKQSTQRADVHGVVFHGFVKDLAEVYSPGSILLAPAFLSGGVKTKVLEAMSYGVIPLGNSIAFEGVCGDFEGLVYSDSQWDQVVQNPASFYEVWNQAGRQAINTALRSHSADYVAARWRNVIWPA